jgi:hypothetical protein
MVDVEGFECRVLAGSTRTLAGLADWAVEVHVGCGLEAAGNSIDDVLSYFPSERYARFVHRDGDREPMPLENIAANKLRERFFLTAIARSLT